MDKYKGLLSLMTVCSRAKPVLEEINYIKERKFLSPSITDEHGNDVSFSEYLKTIINTIQKVDHELNSDLERAILDNGGYEHLQNRITNASIHSNKELADLNLHASSLNDQFVRTRNHLHSFENSFEIKSFSDLYFFDMDKSNFIDLTVDLQNKIPGEFFIKNDRTITDSAQTGLLLTKKGFNTLGRTEGIKEFMQTHKTPYIMRDDTFYRLANSIIVNNKFIDISAIDTVTEQDHKHIRALISAKDKEKNTSPSM